MSSPPAAPEVLPEITIVVLAMDGWDVEVRRCSRREPFDLWPLAGWSVMLAVASVVYVWGTGDLAAGPLPPTLFGIGLVAAFVGEVRFTTQTRPARIELRRNEVRFGERIWPTHQVRGARWRVSVAGTGEPWAWFELELAEGRSEAVFGFPGAPDAGLAEALVQAVATVAAADGGSARDVPASLRRLQREGQ